jgi:uncharacterized protein YrrD
VTAPLMRGRDLVGRVVVDVDTGEDLAEVRDVVFDPAQGRLVGFTLSGNDVFGARLSIDRVTCLGTDAIMIAGAEPSDDTDPGVGRVAAASAADENVVGDLVVTESGRELGRVRDVIVRGGSDPRVVAVEISGGDVGAALVPLSRHLGVSASALVVPDEFEDKVRSDLTGLAVQLDELEGGAR